MKYYIQRGINEYGPYTLADLQRYVAQGNIVLTDLARSEAMTEWTPVSQILGTIPVAPPPAPGPIAPAAASSAVAPSAGTVYGGGPATVGAAPAMAVGGPVPPDLHWALVLLVGFFCAGIFILAWLFIEAAFVKKIKPDSNSLAFLIGGIGLEFAATILFFVALVAQFATNANSQDPPWAAIVILLVGVLAGIAVQIIGIFKMREAIQEYYNTVEPINLRLSGVMTFFFSLFYFQYHFSRIASWKKTGYLVPQQ